MEQPTPSAEHATPSQPSDATPAPRRPSTSLRPHRVTSRDRKPPQPPNAPQHRQLGLHIGRMPPLAHLADTTTRNWPPAVPLASTSDSVTSFRRAESPSALSSHSRAELASEARFHQKKCVVDANCVSSRESKSCGSTMLLNGLTGSIRSGRCIISGDHTSYAQANTATTTHPPQDRKHTSHSQRSPASGG